MMRPASPASLLIALLSIVPLSRVWALTASLTPDPNPPDTGENTVEIQLTDDAGASLEDAKVDLLLYMPAMGTMPYMEEKSTVTAKGGGVYAAKTELSMGGTWEMTLTVEAGGKKETLRYSITTGIPGVTDKNAAKRTSAGVSDATNLMDIGPERLQRIGVKFAEAKVVPMHRLVRAVGLVEQDKTHREEITLRFSGYVVKQFRGRIGETVKKGEPLFSIYSPELVTAQSEYLLASQIAHGSAALDRASAERLINLGMSESDIAQIKKSGKPKRDVLIRSPIGGTILEINAREGAAVSAGQVVVVVGDLSKSFIVARVFQQDIHELDVGQPVEIVLPDRPESPVAGVVDLIFPQVEPGVGTANVRVATKEYVPSLRPGVYVDLRFPIDLGSRLAVPIEAVLYSGLHNYVFVDKGQGLLEPREVNVGATAGDLVEIRSGLEDGRRVVASGAFLLSSEAQLRSALPKWRDDRSAAETKPASHEMPSHKGHHQEAPASGEATP